MARGTFRGCSEPDPDEPWRITIALRPKGNVKVIHSFPEDDEPIFGPEVAVTSPLPKPTEHDSE